MKGSVKPLEEKALKLLEQAYSDYISGSINVTKLCKNISVALSSLPYENGRKRFTVELTKNTSFADFFGMRVFPNLDASKNICEDLTGANNREAMKYRDLLKRWKTISDWTLELDGMLFDRNTLNFTPRELVAMTLHEIGHVIYSDKPLENFYRAYKENEVQLKLADRGTQKAMCMIYMIPLGIACAQRRWINGKDELHVEIITDKTVADFGFGDDLLSALDKIVRKFGSINTDENRQYKEIDSSVEWCNRNIQDVFKRRDTLKDELFYQGIRTKSNFIKAATIYVIDKIGFNLREKYNGIATEATVDLLCDPELLTKYDLSIDAGKSAKFDSFVNMQIGCEALVNKRKKVKAILPSQYEVDAISVEVDNIQNHADRIFVLDLIYNLVERVNIFEEAISPDPALVRKWQDKIDTMREELQMYRKATLEKKTFNKSNYHLFVKLPPQAADYEG